MTRVAWLGVGFLVVALTATVPQPSAYAASTTSVVEQLRTNQIDALEQHFGGVQQAYKRGNIDDEKLLAEFRAFYFTDRSLEPKLSLWVYEKPKSYAARLARGIHHKYVGLEKRGSEFIHETSAAQLAGMDASFHQAMDDLSASMALDDEPLLSILHALDITKHLGGTANDRKLLDLANQIAQKNVIVRRKYLLTLETRWGGSVEQMQQFVNECRKTGLSPQVLRDFQGRVEFDAGWVYERGAMRRRGDAGADPKAHAKAEEKYLVAASLLTDASTALESAGRMQMMQSQPQRALATFNKALQIAPDGAEILARRGHAFVALGQPVQGLADYRRAAELGHVWAQNELGKCYWHGLGTPKDAGEAIKWLEKAAAGGNEEAKTSLAWARKLTPGT